MSSVLLPIVLILLLSAFFSGIEIAFVSANRLKIELDVKKGSLSAKIISGFMKNPGRFISSMLVGNNIALVVYGILMGDLIVSILQLEQYTTTAGAMVIQTALSTLLILVAGEFVPKALFRLHPNALLSFFAIPLFVIYYAVLLVPSTLFSFTSELFLKLLKIKLPKEDVVFGRVDLDQYLQSISQTNSKEVQVNHELEILKNALDFNKIKARDCMIPRPEIEALEVEESIEKLRETFIESGYSKLLIYRDNIDNIIGYVHCNEMFNKPTSIKTVLLPVSIVPETMTAQEVLENFIQQRRALAVVVDEHGGTSGIITMEDIVEEIFGDIEDEHDHEQLAEEQLAPDKFRFSARLEVDYLNNKYNLQIPEKGDYDTLAGFIIHHTENIPKPNTRINIGDFQINITKVSGTRIEEVLLQTNS